MRDTQSRQGMAVAEFALVMALILLPLLAGVVDFSRLMEVRDALTHSARDGVVLASRGAEVNPAVEASVAAAGLSDEKLTITVSTGADQPGLGQEVTVALAYDLTGMTLFSWNWLIGDVMRVQACAKME
ncbi:TadE family protein [Pseudodesulfovibrio sp.]|uniref:TadE/TadG family type IV pilus assembly protein n=1 Tax=Pseudodesulfovibrio sp. TaxID=2035812 RepID=UPI00261329B9|nr:TadE family protein [Pseudodesulfovibrio sp.]MDD3312716.1 pilus assembly protein [Pseudodesulfovibrio sp.]